MPTLTEIISAIEAQQAKQKKCVDILTLIEPVLKSFDGKTISKRIETAIKKVLPEYTINYGKTYSWYELKIWGNGVDYQDSISLTLGYLNENNDEFSFTKYVERNQRHYLDKSRYEELELIKGEEDRIDYLIQRYEAIKKEISEFTKTTVSLPYPVSQYFKL